MKIHSSLLRGIFVAASASLLALAACAEGESDVEYVMQGTVPLGEVWGGPEEKLYSQGNEELIVRDFFEDRTGGFFVDVGAADPIERSTTYYLEERLGWSGIAIDALEEYAPGYAKSRPRTRFFSYIVTDHVGTREKFYRIRGAPELSSTIEGRRWGNETLPADTLEVPTITLDALLEQEGVGRIDFLSLDIEGGEPKALAAFDIERYRPQLICIGAFKKEAKWDAYFELLGYERLEKYARYDFVNLYYTPIAGDGGTDDG